MKITENVNSLMEIMHTLNQLEDTQFIEENGLTPEDVELVKSELQAKIPEHKEEIQSYIEYKLTERQDHVILSSGIGDQIKTLSERKKTEDNKIAKIEGRIDYLCKIAGITGLKTPLAEIKYTGGDKMKLVDISVLPESLKNYTTGVILPKDIEVLKGLGYEVSESAVGLPLIKKRYKELSEDEKKNLEGKVRIDDSKSISIK